MSKSQEDTNGQPGAEAVDEKPEDAQQEPQDTGDGAAAGDATDKPDDEAQDASEAGSMDELPEWASKQIKDLRRESANYRTQLQSVKDASVKTNEEFEDLKSQLAAKDLAFTRERVGVQYGLPAELRDRLRGSTDAEIEEDAKAMAGFIKPAATPPRDSRTPSGGLDAGSNPGMTVEEATAAARRQRR